MLQQIKGIYMTSYLLKLSRNQAAKLGCHCLWSACGLRINTCKESLEWISCDCVHPYSQLMVIPSSTPGFFGSFTWKVPELGMTDSRRESGLILVQCEGRSRSTETRWNRSDLLLYGNHQRVTLGCILKVAYDETLSAWFKTCNKRRLRGEEKLWDFLIVRQNFFEIISCLFVIK